MISCAVEDILETMPSYTLHYFDARGRAEVIRLILAHAGVPVDDKRYKFEQWPELKKDNRLFPFGQCPSFEVDGVVLAQSNAVCRLLASSHGLAGDSPLANAKIDMLIDQFSDIRNKLAPFYYTMGNTDDPEKIKLRKEFCDNYLPDQLRHLERILSENGGGSGFFVGEKVTWGDLAFADLAQVLEEVNKQAFANSPLLKAHIARIRDLPKIKEYLAARPVTIF